MTVTATRYGILNGIPLDTYAWRVVDSGYDELLNTPQLRGEDITMPGAQGVRAYPRVIAATVVSIPLLIVGSLTEDGAAIADPYDGMLTHRDYLRANLGLADDSDPDRGTVPFVFIRGPILDAWLGDVTFLGIQGWTTLSGGDALCRIDLSLPTELDEAGS